MNLVVVESPTKAKTIEKYLGKDYKVVASYGHIRDLPEKELGIEIPHNFKPRYIVPSKSKKIVLFLKKQAESAKDIYLATDLDREGEAIAWHIVEVLKPKQKPKRITFHEITKDTIIKALKNPRDIDMDLVDAQQARRILDRLVGYKLSPLLWKKVAKRLSAGRVQSVAVRLIVDREREIQTFKPVEYWTIIAMLHNSQNKTFSASLTHIGQQKLEKLDIKNQKQAESIKLELEKAKYAVKSIETKDTFRNPLPPFTTSTLQIDASRKLGFSAKKTMLLAQQLYEGVELGKEGSVGLITYMRTDSVHLSEPALEEIILTIREKFGPDYAVAKPRRFKTKIKGAQEAHEAIRPTSIGRAPESVSSYLNPDQLKLYDLIWKRTIATQMQPAKFETTSVNIIATLEDIKKPQTFTLHATGSRLIFPGFLKVYTEEKEDHEKEKISQILPKLVEGQKLDLEKILTEQHFTEPPPRYSEATLVKALKEQGIGRPSTYAPIMSTIQERGYVRKENGRFYPNEIGIVVNDLLVKHFPNIVDIKFTARMEEDLDKIAAGKKKMVSVIRKFYEPFAKELEKKTEEIKKSEVMVTEPTKELCEKCGKPMIIRLSRYGKFLSCSGFPECKTTKPLEGKNAKFLPVKLVENLTERCEQCGGKLIIRRSKFGKFLGCSNYPKCKHVVELNKLKKSQNSLK